MAVAQKVQPLNLMHERQSDDVWTGNAIIAACVRKLKAVP